MMVLITNNYFPNRSGALSLYWVRSEISLQLSTVADVVEPRWAGHEERRSRESATRSMSTPTIATLRSLSRTVSWRTSATLEHQVSLSLRQSASSVMTRGVDYCSSARE